ncbi:MAG: methylcobamide--CoM methyltransferase [Deltaproteobacteria bacterium]|nr:methylcobamide--CoM methyltransferase [Deltaproteobacteria bacterium]MBI3076100.1 methylcobamide--CoM methyltransferase [Deltaproteobacteria bacterium]
MFKTTVVGSYPRVGDTPELQRLRRAIGEFEQGRRSLEELRQVEDDVTREVITEQARAGVDLITDGLIRWYDPVSHLCRHATGFEINGLLRFFDNNFFIRQPVVKEEVHWAGPSVSEEYRFAQAHAGGHPVKAVLMGPYTLARFAKDTHYGDFRALLRDLTVLVRTELVRTLEAGAQDVQVDEPALLEQPGDFPLLLAALRELLDGVKARTCLALYFGSLRGIAEALRELPVTGLLVDVVSRPENLEILAQGAWPADRSLVLGLLDARNTKLEPPEQVAELARRVAGRRPAESLWLAPSFGLELLPREAARRKLERLVECAAFLRRTQR